MKRWPVVILVILLVLGAVVPGCRHVPQYDSRLTAADSLMRINPDSSLALLESLNSSPARGEVARSDGGGGVAPARGEVARSDGGGGATLTTPADRAYYGLLLSQARYKAYVTATSDSDINRALDYYKKHPAEREKLTRAYIYKGAVMEELGHPDSAMFYYKHAEASAAPDDYFNLGYSNMRIAKLYQSLYTNDSAVLARMKMATDYFTIINDTNYLITTIGVQGALYDSDSTEHYLEKAIFLADAIKSPKKFIYQSKLAGYYFYKEDYTAAKNLAMDIILNGADECDEGQFYYYAARSYIQLNLLDSARWVMSMIPLPIDAVDSFNHYQTLAELSKATQKWSDYVQYNEVAKEIDNRIMETSRASKLTETELKYEAYQLKNAADEHLVRTIGLVLLGAVVLFTVVVAIIRSRIRYYRNQLDANRQELEKLIADIDVSRLQLEKEREKYSLQLAKKDNELAAVSKKRYGQDAINKQVSNIVRYRLAALNELYQNIRITSVRDDGYKRSLLLVSTIRELYEKKGILHTLPKDSFWKNLRLSVDGEFEGIVSFVESNYPNLTEKDMQLFLLLCAGLPNQIIKMCMKYTDDTTVSKRKKKLMTEKFGLDVKLDKFIQMYLDGQLGKQ